MTQNNDEALIEFKDVVKQLCNDFSSLRGNVYIKDVEASLDALCEQFIEQSPISQNEQKEAVDLHERIRNLETQLQNWKDFCKKIQASPPKQIPDEWRPIETVPKDGTQVIIKCSGGRVATAFYDDKQFFGEGWHVVVPFLGGFGSGTDTFIYFQEDMPTHWMPLPAQTTSLTSETNTEVGK